MHSSSEELIKKIADNKLYSLEISNTVAAGVEKLSKDYDKFARNFIDKNSFYLEKTHQLICFTDNHSHTNYIQWTVWDISTKKMESEGNIKLNMHEFRAVVQVVMLSGEHFAFGDDDGYVSIFNIKTQKIEASHKAHNARIYDIFYDPHTNRITTSAEDRSIFIASYDTGLLKFNYINCGSNGVFFLDKRARSLVTMNDKLYAIGSYKGDTTLKEIDIFDEKHKTSILTGPYRQILNYYNGTPSGFKKNKIVFSYKDPDYLSIYNFDYADDEKIQYPNDDPRSVHFISDDLILVKTGQYLYLHQHNKHFRAFKQVARINPFSCRRGHAQCIALPNKEYIVNCQEKFLGLLSLHQITPQSLCDIFSNVKLNKSIEQLILLDQALEYKNIYGLYQLTLTRKDIQYKFSKEIEQQLEIITKYEDLLESKTEEIEALKLKQAEEEQAMHSLIERLEEKMQKNYNEQNEKINQLQKELKSFQAEQKQTNEEILSLLNPSQPSSTEPLIETVRKTSVPDLQLIQRLLAENSIAYWNLIKFSGHEHFERYANDLKEKKAITSAKDLAHVIQTTEVRSNHSENLKKALDQLMEDHKSRALPPAAKKEMREWVRPQAKTLLDEQLKKQVLEWKKETFKTTFGANPGSSFDISTLPIPEPKEAQILKELFDAGSEETERVIHAAILTFMRGLKDKLERLPESQSTSTVSLFS